MRDNLYSTTTTQLLENLCWEKWKRRIGQETCRTPNRNRESKALLLTAQPQAPVGTVNWDSRAGDRRDSLMQWIPAVCLCGTTNARTGQLSRSPTSWAKTTNEWIQITVDTANPSPQLNSIPQLLVLMLITTYFYYYHFASVYTPIIIFNSESDNLLKIPSTEWTTSGVCEYMR